MCLASTASRSLRGFQVGPAGLGVPPRGHRLSDNGSDPLLESVGSWVCFAVASARPAGLGEAGRPASGPSRPLVLPRLHSAFVYSQGKWVAEILLILGCFVGLWIEVKAFLCIQLNQGPTLDSEPHECVSLPLDRSRGHVYGGARLAGLGEAARPGILPNSAQFWCTYSCNQNSSKTHGTR